MWIKKKQVDVLKEQVELLRIENDKLRKSLSKEVVDRIVDRPIKWIEWQKMPHDKKVEWYKNAQSVLRNIVFRSLVGSNEPRINGEIVKNIIEHIARHTENFEQVRDLRMTINGVELIKQYLEEIPNPEENVTKDEIYKAI